MGFRDHLDEYVEAAGSPERAVRWFRFEMEQREFRSALYRSTVPLVEELEDLGITDSGQVAQVRASYISFLLSQAASAAAVRAFGAAEEGITHRDGPGSGSVDDGGGERG